MAIKRYFGWTDRDTTKKGYADLDTRFSSRNTKAEGLLCDSVTDDRAALDLLANTTMQPGGGQIDVVGVPRLATNVTIPSNVTLKFVDGAYLAPDGGVVVTLNGAMKGATGKRFGGGGTVTFATNNKVKRVFPEWWGAQGDGTDDLIPLNSTIAAAAGTQVYLRTIYTLSTRLLVMQKDNLSIVGGAHSTSGLKIKNGVANPGYVLEMYDCTNTAVRNVSLNGNRANLTAGWNEFNGGLRWGANGGQVRSNENLSVTGCHVFNTGGDSVAVVGVSAAAILRNIVIAHNVLEDFNTGGAGAARQGIALTCGQGVQILGNTIRGTPAGDIGQWGIDVETDPGAAGMTVKDAAIVGNTITDCNGVRIVAGSATNSVDHVRIGTNTIRTHATTAQAGIATSQNVRAVGISDNSIFVQEAGATGFGIQLDIGGTSISISDNDIEVHSTGAAGNGIQMGGAVDIIDTTGFKITGNHVHHCKGHGIIAKRLYTVITGNYCRFNGGDGIRLAATTDGASGSIVENNISILNTGWGVTVEAGVTDYTVKGNNVQSNTAGSINDLAQHPSGMVMLNKGHPLWDRQNAIPVAGTFKVGDIIYNNVPASAGFIGWVCTVAGTPGTWKTFGVIS